MSDDVIVNERVRIPAWELEYYSSRSSGPGGQAVNKTNSRVSLRWHVDRSSALTTSQKMRVHRNLGHRIDSNGYLSIHVETERSQTRNKSLAVERLAALLVKALVIQKGRRKTKPTKASKERRIQSKKQKSQKKRLRQKPASFD